jgi:hypothetical protein
MKNPRKREGPSDGASRTRTGDLLGAIQALFQLSYSPAEGPMVAAWMRDAPVLAGSSEPIAQPR